MAVVLSKFGHQLGHVFCQLMLVCCRVGNQYFAHACNLCSRVSHRATTGTCYQDVQVIAHLRGGGNCVQCCTFQGAIVVFCNNQNSH